jgi:hypothetical protein
MLTHARAGHIGEIRFGIFRAVSFLGLDPSNLRTRGGFYFSKAAPGAIKE